MGRACLGRNSLVVGIMRQHPLTDLGVLKVLSKGHLGPRVFLHDASPALARARPDMCSVRQPTSSRSSHSQRSCRWLVDASKTLSAPLKRCNCGVGMGRALTFVAFAIGWSSGCLGQASLDADVPGKVELLQAARCCLSFGCASFLHILAFARSVR